ncbi:MAG TPA: ATP-dependent protease ATPase subunit HslU [Fimbriimonadaceae bacterium]
MDFPLEELTPRQIVAELDKYIVGQANAKRAVAVALRNRYRRQQLPAEQREEILPKNILMIGPTGVGKTEIARRLAQLARAPFIKVEATKFTEVGYVGRDVESMIRDLAGVGVRLVEKERMETVRPEVERKVLRILLDLLDEDKPKSKKKKAPMFDNPIMKQAFEIFGQNMDDGYPDEPEAKPDDDEQKKRLQRRKKLEKRIAAGEMDQEIVEIETEEPSHPFVQVFSAQGMEEMGLDSGNQGGPFSGRRTSRSVTVAEAKEILIEQEAHKIIDRSSVNREAVHRTEQSGIIFIDELDKVASKGGGSGPEVSREGVQRDLLPIIEGSTVATKFGPVKTDHILFIAAGAFHMAKPSDLIPELQGRLPIRVELENLTETDFRRILREPKNALTKQYQLLLSTEGITVEFTEGALDEIAKLSAEVNSRTENIGARRLHTVMEKLLEEVLYDAPDTPAKSVRFDRETVCNKISGLVNDIDLSRYIL